MEVRGSIFPRAIKGRCIALCAIIRMILCSFYVALYAGHYDAIVVDQVSACVPILRFFGRKILFYCHFPDKLLCVERTSILKKFYRYFIDAFEEISTGMSHLIVVNSDFTKQIFKQSFTFLNMLKVNPAVLYPAVDFSKFDKTQANPEGLEKQIDGQFFLSLNRYERKKNINLAIMAFALFKNKTP